MDKWYRLGCGTGRLFGGLSNGFEFFGSSLTEGTDFYDVIMEWAGCETVMKQIQLQKC